MDDPHTSTESIQMHEIAASNGPSELFLRVISALVLGVSAIFLTLYGDWPFSLMVGLLGILISREWLAITTIDDQRDDVLGTLLYWLLFILSMSFVMAGEPGMAAWSFVLSALLLMVWKIVVKAEIWTAPGLIYAGIPMAALYALRNHPSGEGIALVFGLFAIVWATDIFAYFVGRKVGGAKLMPSISPNKTWSGFYGGVAAAIVFAAIASFFLVNYGLFAAIAVGAVLSIVSQGGDLFESFIKRKFGVKDSGNIIPGHGGFMDRVDGLIAAAVIAALLLM